MDLEPSSTTLRCKVAVVGAAAVGKTALCSMLADGKFPKTYRMTTVSAPDAEPGQVSAPHVLYTKRVAIPDTAVSVELFLVDVPGHEVLSDFAPRYWDGAAAVVGVYDITQGASLETCMAMVGACRESEQLVASLLVANKIDLDERAAIPRQAGVEASQQANLAFFEASAAESTNVASPFTFIAMEFYKAYESKCEEYGGGMVMH